MRYYLDTKFNGAGGQLMSLALVPETGQGFLWIEQNIRGELDPWVAEHVFPVIASVPDGRLLRFSTAMTCGEAVTQMLAGDTDPVIIADWPDIAYLCKALLTVPGEMEDIRPRLAFILERVDAYPTQLEGAIRHNAWWDAMALRAHLTGREILR